MSQASRNRVLIDQALAKLPALPRPVCEVRHVSTLLGLVEIGLAVAVVPRLTLPPAPAAAAFSGLLARAGKRGARAT